jgi:hypothetical protein
MNDEDPYPIKGSFGELLAFIIMSKRWWLAYILAVSVSLVGLLLLALISSF